MRGFSQRRLSSKVSENVEFIHLTPIPSTRAYYFAEIQKITNKYTYDNYRNASSNYLHFRPLRFK